MWTPGTWIVFSLQNGQGESNQVEMLCGSWGCSALCIRWWPQGPLSFSKESSWAVISMASGHCSPSLAPASGFEVIWVRSKLNGSCSSFCLWLNAFVPLVFVTGNIIRAFFVPMRLGQNQISLPTGCFPFLAKQSLVPGAFQLPKSPCYIPSL